MSRSGNVRDNAAMKSFFSSLKTECIARKTYRTRNQARADMFDYIERFFLQGSVPQSQPYDGVHLRAAVESTQCTQQKTARRRSQEMTGFRSHLLLAFVMGEVRELMAGCVYA